MANNHLALGRILCKGSGLRVFLEINLSKKDANGEKKYKKFRYEIGNLQQIIAETNRQANWIHVVGRKNAVGVSKGLRSTYGTIVFTQIDLGFLKTIFTDIRKYNHKTKMFSKASLDGYGYDDFTLTEQDQELFSAAKEEFEVTVHENEILNLADLPPVDIVVYGNADQIEQVGDTVVRYNPGKQYVFRCNKVTFLSETFGVSAGGPMHDVATKCYILGSIEPWREVQKKLTGSGN